MILKGLKMASVLSLLSILSAVWVWVNSQQERMVALQETNIRMGQQLQILQTHIEAAHERESQLSAALTSRQQTQQQLEEAHEQYQQQLRQSVVQSPCASKPVPDDVIRLQRNTFRGDTTSG
jgi:hypothetical protein